MGTQYTGTILGENPAALAYYKLDEASGLLAHDTSTNTIQNNGTISNSGVTYNQAGAIISDADPSMLFDGTAGNIILPSTINPNNLAGITFECWFKLTNVTFATTPVIIANAAPATSKTGLAVTLDASGAGIHFIIGNGSTSADAHYTVALTAGTWYHLMVTYDSTTMTLYLNGVSHATASISGPIANAANQLVLGHSPVGSNDFLPGNLDEVVITGFALSSGQVTNHYTSGTAKNTAIYYIPNNTKTRIVQPEDINQALNVLNQPAGGQETGYYLLAMPGYAANATCSYYMTSQSRGSTPVSVTVDATETSNVGFTVSPPNTGGLTASGFQIYDFCATGAQPNPVIGGKYTTNF